MTFLWAIVLFGLLIFFHELGHFIFSKIVGVKVLKFSLGFGPKILGKRIGETEYLISAIPLGGYVKPLGEDPGEELPEDERHRAFNTQPLRNRALIVMAGPFFNMFLAYIIFVVFLAINVPVAIPKIDSISTTIENVMEGSPAMEAGLKPDDTIISIDEVKVNDWGEMAEIFSKNPGKELTLRVKRGEEILTIKVTPEPTKVKGEGGAEITIGRIGVSKKMDAKIITSSGILDIPLRAFEAVIAWCLLTLEVVIKLLIGSISAKQLGGPILIVDAAAKAASVGLLPYFNLVAIISVNLAILNLMPVPVLDGGHLMFMGVEAIMRRPLNERILMIANRIGMAILLMLITFVFYNDIVRVIIPWIKEILH